MVRILLLAAGIMLMLGIYFLHEHFNPEASRSWREPPIQIRLAADPSLKDASEVSPYMRNER